MRRLLIAAVAVAALAASSRALTPAQLTPDESAAYQGLKDDDDAAKTFLDTRGFLRQCRKVANKTLPAAKLPVQPADYDSQYVSDDEQSVVDDAVMKYVSARIGGAG